VLVTVAAEFDSKTARVDAFDGAQGTILDAAVPNARRLLADPSELRVCALDPPGDIGCAQTHRYPGGNQL
jgi:hypothetical protein